MAIILRLLLSFSVAKCVFKFTTGDITKGNTSLTKCDMEKLENFLSGMNVVDSLNGLNSLKFKEECYQNCPKPFSDFLVVPCEKNFCSNTMSKCIFIQRMYGYIAYNLRHNYYCYHHEKAIIVKALSQIYDHFRDKPRKELILFMTNAMFNTSYMKIFVQISILNSQIKKYEGYNASRGLLQITYEENYAIANRYKGSIDFMMHPEKMAFLKYDQIKATLHFWDYMIVKIKKEGKKVDYETVLCYLKPREVLSWWKTDEQKAKLKNRKEIYKELTYLFGYYC